jgi:exosortase/archaeosortase
MRRRKNRTLATIAWFVVKFNLLALPMYLAIFSGFSHEPLRISTAWISNVVLNSIGYTTIQSGHTIQTSVADVDISWDSTGWKSMYALVALALATPLGNRSRLKFIAMLRIVTTIGAALSYGMQYFDILHLLLWREGLITAVVAIWGAWLWREKDNITKEQGIFRWVFGKQS